MTLFVFADTHIGTTGANIKKLKRHIQQCKDEGASWLHLGDWCDALTPMDRRYDIRHPTLDISTAYHKVYELFEPIKDKGLAILEGNHDYVIARAFGDQVLRLGSLLKVPYLGYSGFVKLKLQKFSRTIFLHHGAGGGRKRGAKAIRLKEWMEQREAELYLQGHTHAYMQFTEPRVVMGKKYTKYFANAPGYLENGGYVERLGLGDVDTGCLRIVITKENIKIEPIL